MHEPTNQDLIDAGRTSRQSADPQVQLLLDGLSDIANSYMRQDELRTIARRTLYRYDQRADAVTKEVDDE